MHRRHRPIVIPTQRRGSPWLKFGAGLAVLSGVALGGMLLGMRWLEPLPAHQGAQAGAPPETTWLLEPPAAGAQPERTLEPSAAPTAPNRHRGPQPVMAPAAAPPACADCGVVESVQLRPRGGATTGVGAVAGGVVGGLLGNQFGKGDGRRAMTVVGAVGGGLLGHEIEKKQRTHTDYLVRVRMADGRLVERVQAAVVPVGSTVRVGDQGVQLLEPAR